MNRVQMLRTPFSVPTATPFPNGLSDDSVCLTWKEAFARFIGLGVLEAKTTTKKQSKGISRDASRVLMTPPEAGGFPR